VVECWAGFTTWLAGLASSFTLRPSHLRLKVEKLPCKSGELHVWLSKAGTDVTADKENEHYAGSVPFFLIAKEDGIECSNLQQPRRVAVRPRRDRHPGRQGCR